jgi:hypothetical protein
MSNFYHSVDIVISVNQNEPERNILFTVIPFHDVEDHNSDLHNGYEIILKGDLGDYIQDKFKATVANKKEVLLELPCASASYLKSFGDGLACLKTNNDSRYRAVSERGHAVLRGQRAQNCGSKRTIKAIGEGTIQQMPIKKTPRFL